jgi:hypothetical protein
VTFLRAATEVESLAFSARVNIASDFRTFLRAVAAEEAMSSLALLIKDPETAFRLMKRTLALVEQRFDYRYEHPRDSAIATYLLLLAARWPQLAGITAEAAASVPRTWWAAQVAREILERHHLQTSSNTQTEPISEALGGTRVIAETPARADRLLLGDFLSASIRQANAVAVLERLDQSNIQGVSETQPASLTNLLNWNVTIRSMQATTEVVGI